MPLIFLSYRRSLSPHLTDRLARDLTARFGRGTVFQDTSSIPLGADWRDEVEATIRRCRVVLAVVGPGWQQGLARHDDPVRLELETALRHSIPIIPVFDGAGFPPLDQLPPSLHAVTRRIGEVFRPDPGYEPPLERLVSELANRHGILAAPGWVARGRTPPHALSRECYDALLAGRFAQAAECLSPILGERRSDPRANLLMAVALIAGREPKTLGGRQVDEVQQHLSAAASDPDLAATADYLLAVIKHDHHFQNGVSTSPTFTEVVGRVRSADPDRLDRRITGLVPRSPRIDRLLEAALRRAPHRR